MKNTPPNTAHATSRTAPRAGARRRRRGPISLIGDVVLAIAAALISAPFLYTVVTSLRPASDVVKDPFGWPTSLTFDNITNAFSKMNYAQGVLNSTIVLVGTMFLTIVAGSLAAYPLARITRSWSTWVYRIFIAGSTVPIFVLIAPLYLLMRDVGLLNSYAGIILTNTAINLPVAIFFYTSFFRQIPIELEEAAAIDGSGPIRTFFVVLFPAALLGVAPLLIVFAFLQRYVVSGLTMGAVKS